MSETPETQVAAAGIVAPLDDEARRNERHNYWVTVIEGGAFIGGMAFLNAQTLLPDMLRQLGASPLLISLAPSLTMIGFWTAPILTAHWVDGMHRYMPFVSFTGILQRIPYLLAAIALFVAANGIGVTFALITVASAPLISGIAGGTSLTAWQQLVARCVPEKRRASLLAHRYIISCILGVIAGLTANALFTHFSLLTAYATLHLIAFIFIAISYFTFIATREPHSPPPAVHTLTLTRNLQLMPRLLRGNPQFQRYLVSRVLRNGLLIITPFLAIFARESLNLPESFLGTLVIANMLGAVLGNIGAAWLGDRAGGKIVNQVGLALFILVAAWSAFAGSPFEFIAIFFLMGAAFYAGEVGAFTLLLEIVPLDNRATYLAIASLVNVPAMAAASLLSSSVWKHTHSITWLAVATIITLAGSILLLQPIREPRQRVRI